MYTSREAIEEQSLIPAKLPWDGTTAEERFSTWIDRASREIDSGVGPDFPVLPDGWKFSSHPDTPEAVALAAEWLVASRALQALGIVARANEGPPMWVTYRKMAQEQIKGIRKKEIDVFDSDGEELDADTPTPITVAARPPVVVGGWSTEYY
ncbi:MAG: hypothetical protein OXI23_18610 [Gemmatimonadota bacterium]|nr:hypothetical protein [Gemmatimonadota bacterium]